MYDERREKFSFKSFFLTLLLVLLFVFLMLWLFPTKNYVDRKFDSYDMDRISILYDEIFANNISRMKDAAIGYFTNERLPKTAGESKKLTLKEMYDLHLVLKMKDKKGKACDVKKSYVEMTKYTEEYRLKVNLKCGDQEDYIIVYLGCYNYCPDGICEKRVSTPSKTTAIEEKKDKKYYCEVVNGKYYDKSGNIVNEKEYNESCNPVIKKYLYEYKLTVADSKTCSGWSNWQKNKITATDLVQVETKSVKELTGYKEVKVPVVKKEKVTQQVTERYISNYVDKLVYKGTKDVQVGTTKQIVTEKVVVGKILKSTGIIDTGSRLPQDTSTTHYELLSVNTPPTCSYCENETSYTWEIYDIEPVYDVVEKEVEVPVMRTVEVYETEKVPVYDFRIVEKEVEVEKTVYETKKIAEYANVTYYRSKTCKIVKGYTDIKWSESKFDSNLIGKGYVLTGNVKEV